MALGLILTHRSSGVVNFAHAAMGMYVAYAYFEFRETGDWVLPFLGLPDRVHLMPRPTLVTALAFALVLATLLGLAVYLLVFRPLRRAPALARIVASLGLLLYLQEIVRLRFPVSGASVVVRRPVLPDEPVALFGTTVTENRLILVALVVVVAAVLALVFRVTRFGLATRAAESNEKGALLLGIAPDRLASISWVVASILAGAAIILIEPIAGLTPTTSLLVIPALAAALLGGLQSFGVATAAGLAIGMAQSLVLGWSVRPDTSIIPSWLPTTGLQQVIPAAVIIAVLIWRGDALPDRAAIAARRLPPSPRPRHVVAWTVGLVAVVSVALVTVGAGFRQGLIVSMVFALLALSVVVLTGFTGQISLAQLAFAGVAGFTSIRLAENSVPFPLAMLVAALVATVVGVAVGWPATRVRGMSLAIATLALGRRHRGTRPGQSEPLQRTGRLLGAEALPLRPRCRHHGDRRRQLPPGVRLRLPGRARAGVARRGQPPPEPHRAPVVGGAGQRARRGRCRDRRHESQARSVRRLVVPRRAVRGAHGLLGDHALAHLVPRHRVVGGGGAHLPRRGVERRRRAGGRRVWPRPGSPSRSSTTSPAREANTYVFAISGLALIAAAIWAPEGLTGLVRVGVARLGRVPATSADGPLPPVTAPASEQVAR